MLLRVSITASSTMALPAVLRRDLEAVEDGNATGGQVLKVRQKRATAILRRISPMTGTRSK